MDLQKENAKISQENPFELNDEALEKVIGGCSERGGDDWHRGHDHNRDWDWHHRHDHDHGWDWRHRR